MKSPLPAISPTELEVLRVVWKQGPGTVREIRSRLRQRGRRWVYTTVQTLLHRLRAKGFVTQDKSGIAHVFHPAVSRDDLLRQGLRDLAERLCEGTATPLVTALVEGNRFTAKDIDHFRRMLDELEKKKKKGGATKKGK